MKLAQRGDVSDFGTTPAVHSSEPQTASCSTPGHDEQRCLGLHHGSTKYSTLFLHTIAPNNGRSQTSKLPTNVPHNFPATAFGLHFAPNYQLAMNPMPAQQSSASPNSTRPKVTKVGRPPPCHHARYVLDDKPPRTSAANENMECTNCGTKNTSAWRRSAEGKSECNACNLFFRKNGRKRPASMRRDTISRRYRLSRCDLCAMEAQGGQTDFAQFQKAVARHRRNGKASAKAAVAAVQQSTEASLPPPLSGKPEQAASTEASFFVPHPEFPPNFPPFMPPNMDYNHHNPVMMGYAMERPVFDVGDVEQSLNRLNDRQICFARHSHSTRPPEGEVYGQHLLMPPEPTVPMKHDTLHERFSVGQGDVNTQNANEQYEQFEQAAQPYSNFSIDKKVPATELINGSHLENHYGDYKMVKKEDTASDLLACSASAPGPEVQQENTPPTDRALRDQESAFDLLNEVHEEENMIVFRSL